MIFIWIILIRVLCHRLFRIVVSIIWVREVVLLAIQIARKWKNAWHSKIILFLLQILVFFRDFLFGARPFSYVTTVVFVIHLNQPCLSFIVERKLANLSERCRFRFRRSRPCELGCNWSGRFPARWTQDQPRPAGPAQSAAGGGGGCAGGLLRHWEGKTCIDTLSTFLL